MDRKNGKLRLSLEIPANFSDIVLNKPTRNGGKLKWLYDFKSQDDMKKQQCIWDLKNNLHL